MPKQIVIFEGPDGGGKSTFAALFGQIFQVPVDHHGTYLGETGDQISGRYSVSMEPALAGRREVIMDRCWVSEDPYGNVCRGVDRLGVSGHNALTALFQMAVNPVIFFCLPPFDVCLENYRSRRQLEYVSNGELLRRIYDRYQELYVEYRDSDVMARLIDYRITRPIDLFHMGLI